MEKQPSLSIWAQLGRGTVLTDLRTGTWGDTFGTVENVARQYGIKIEESDGGLVFSAPKTRLQMFVERLHFSGKAFRPLD